MVGFLYFVITTGRCYYGVRTARKIVYPDRAEYIGKDITDDGTRSVGGMLQMDHVYFSSEGDVELAKNLSTYCPVRSLGMTLILSMKIESSVLRGRG
jgi:hypothetical protein